MYGTAKMAVEPFSGSSGPRDITNACILLVDDYEHYIHRGQESQWVQIEQFDYPYLETVDGFLKVLEILENRHLFRTENHR